MQRAKLNKAQARELDAVEFPALSALVAKGSRTRSAFQSLQAMHPWDGACALRRLRQMELVAAWEKEPERLPVAAFDESFDELINPAGWPLPEHWRQLREGMKATAVLLRTVAGLGWQEGQKIPVGVHPEIDLLQVTAAILPDPSSIAEKLQKTFTEDGELDPMRIPVLSDLHRDRMRRYQSVQHRLQRILTDASDAFQEQSIVERNGRFCLPVRTDRKGSVPGLVLDRSSSGASLFIEPFEVVALNNDYVEADRAYLQAVQSFLREFLSGLRERKEDFRRWREFQGEVDEILALLRWQGLCDGSLPILDGTLNLCEARHPLLLPAVRRSLELDELDHDVVPLNLCLTSERPGLVISGSNTGGKTVVLKTVGLLAALANSGCAIPAKAGTELPLLPSLHADIGDHQTLVGSLSTFSSHIVHLRQILQHAKPGGLVFLDELGTGTDPKEGAALGIAVLHALSKRRCWVMCSTHLGDISQWALRHQRFQNASVQFDEERMAPTYRLLVGQPGQSRALTIASKLGLPPFVLEHAERVMGKREQDWREFLRQLEADRLQLLEETEVLRRQQQAVEKDRLILQEREEKIRAQQEKFHSEGQDKLARALDFIEHESRRLVRELKDKQKSQENADRVGNEATERVKTIAQIARMEMEAVKPKVLTRGQLLEVKLDGFARHRGLGVEGKVVSMKGDRVVLQTPQGRRLEAKVGELEPIVRAEMQEERSGRVRFKSTSQPVESELNLIGRASDDIDVEVHRFIEEALGIGQKFIRVVHGHGTGRLKAAVRDALKGHPGIARVEDAPQAQGGAGATLITLK